MHSLIPSRRRSNRPASTSTSPRLPLEPGVTFPPQTLTTPGSAPATSAEHATPPSTYPRFANDPNMLVTAERISSSGAQAVMRANRLRLCNSLGGLIPDNISERLLDPSVDAYDSVRQLVGYACSHSTRLMTGIDSYIASWDSGGVVGESLGRGTGPGSGTWGIAGEIVQNYDPAADNHRPRRASLSTPSGTGTTPRMSALPAPRLRRPSQAASPARFGGPSMPTPAAVPPSRGPGFPAGYLPSAQGAVASSPPAQRLRAVSMSGQGSGSGAYPGSSALPGARSMALRVPSDLYAFPGPGEMDSLLMLADSDAILKQAAAITRLKRDLRHLLFRPTHRKAVRVSLLTLLSSFPTRECLPIWCKSSTESPFRRILVGT